MDEQLRNALVSHDVEFVIELLKPSEALQPPVIDYEILSNQLLEYKWFLPKVVDLGEPEITRLFLRGNESMNVDEGLRVAVGNFDVDHVRLFLQEFNADPNSFDEDLQTPMYHLYSDYYVGRHQIDDELNPVTDKAVEIMKMLIERGAKMVTSRDDYYNDLQVRHILEHGTTEAVSIVLNMDQIDLKEHYNDGRTVAHYLARNRNPNTLTLLANRDFCVHSSDVDGMTPLWLAAASGNAQAVEFLLKKGANPNIATDDYFAPFTPLGIATLECESREAIHYELRKADYIECILFLLEHGADVQEQILEDFDPPPTMMVFNLLCYLSIDQRSSEVIEVIMQDLALQAAIGTTITEYVQDTIDSNAILKKQLDIGRQLLQSQIFGPHTLFSVLTCGEENLVSLMRNEQLAKILQSHADHLKSINSIYYNRLLQKRLTKAVEIMELREKAAFVAGKLIEMDYNCQPVVVDIVLSYLDLEDLKTLLNL